MALELRDYLLTDAGVAIAGWTVNLRTGRKTGAAGSILFSTTTSADGMWEFVDGSGGVTLVAGTKYDVQAVSGSHERWWRGYTAIPQSFTELQLNVALGKPTNALTNGDMSVWQRGTSFAAAVSAAYTADRWRWVGSGAGVVTVARDTSVPTVGANALNTPYSLKLTATTADTAIAGADVYFLDQLVEGYDYRALTNGFALSFWVKAAITGTYCVAFRNKGSDRSYVAEYTISAANTWEYKTVAIAAPPTAGTWDYATGIGLQVMFVLADTTKGATAGSWQAAVNYATNNQVNGMNTGQVFQLALVNLIPGSTAAPLVPLPVAVQFDRCQRYYEVLADASHVMVTTGQCVSGTNARCPRPLAVEKGAAPTVNIVSPTNFVLKTASGANQACTALTSAAAYPNLVELDAIVASGLVAGNATRLEWSTAGSIAAEWDPA